MSQQEILERIKNLPDTAKVEVADFIEFLSKKYAGTKKKGKEKGGLNFAWQGAIKNAKGKFTSVDLQHKANEWRNI